MAFDDPSTNGEPSTTNGRHYDESTRPPRLPRWTRQEILVLIQGKRVAEGRARRGRVGGSAQLEPKWASVASYCKRHGVNRGPVQCRKRWSNLAGDFKKIKEWETNKLDGPDSFWVMRNDLRRERRLPGFFDREVYDILDGADAKKGGEEVAEEAGEEEDEAEVIFDSGRSAAAEEGLFSDFEQSGSPEKEVPTAESPVAVAAPTPISEKQYQPFHAENLAADVATEKQPSVNPEKVSTSQGQKRRRILLEADGATPLQNHLIEVLEQNSKMLTAQFEAQNINCQLDRDLRKDHTASLVGVLGKLADALGKIADKL